MTNYKEVAQLQPIQTQPATFTPDIATADATHAQPTGLKAAAMQVLQRNTARNSRATESKNARNFSPESGPEKLREVAHDRLAVVAQEFQWSLAVLLDWYKADRDIADLARWPMETVRQVVLDYITNHDLCQGDYRSLEETR